MPFAEKLLYVSGTGDVDANGKGSAGKLGKDFTLEDGQRIARTCALNIIGNLHAALGDLNKIKRMVKVLAFVASADEIYGMRGGELETVIRIDARGKNR